MRLVGPQSTDRVGGRCPLVGRDRGGICASASGKGASPAGRPSHAFTLIELLVCVAIIGILIGILLPVLSRARDSAGDAICQSHLKQIGQASIQYAHDNHDYWPTARPIPQPFQSASSDPPLPEPLQPYTDVALGHKLYHCPNDNGHVYRLCGSSYYYQPLLSGLRALSSPTISYLGWDDSGAVMVGDYDNGEFIANGNLVTVPPFHARRNYVFTDGHVGHVLSSDD